LEALDLLDRVPRFRVVGTEDDRRTVFVGMISYRDAQEDLTRRGRAWADQHIARVIQDVHDHLEAYDPQAALDVLAARKRVERFAEDEISEKLRSFEQRANEDLRKRQHAERRSAQAIQLLEQGNPLGAWDIYREAYAVYSGAPSLPETRDAVLAQMISDLETMIVKAEEAFNARLMERIGQIYQSARVDYSDKAPELEGLLSRLEEIDWQARAFTEYRSSASQMLDEMRDLVITDVSAAADMLARLEEYPVLVLDDLPGLVEVRAAIRRRLNVEMLYNRLYKLLHSDSIEEVEQGVAESADQRDDDRFRQLEFDLETHLNYLNGHLEYAIGQRREALMLFQQVAEHDGHPDQSDAQRLIHEIEADMQAPDEPEIDSE
jgi:tetratricopeptide (TPR) repeat protein